MAQVFNRFRPGYELVKVNFDWNVQVPFLQTTEGNGKQIGSSLFSPKETPNSQWLLLLSDNNKTELSICVWHYDSAGQSRTANIIDPVLVKISILDEKKNQVFQKILPSQPNSRHVEFVLTKEMVIKSGCKQADGSYTFSCKIISHVKKKPIPTTDPTSIAINCSDGLVTHLEGLFDEMKFSDVNFNIGLSEFPAHKNILAARSEVFAAMFEHPTKENLTNQIKIEDIEPEVFHELLRFIYTGRLPMDKMETMAAGLLIAADNYLLEDLKSECENYLLRQVSPDNCVVLLQFGNLVSPAEHLNKAAKFFRRYPSQVMATDGWKKTKQENPTLLFDILEFVYRYK